MVGGALIFQVAGGTALTVGSGNEVQLHFWGCFYRVMLGRACTSKSSKADPGNGGTLGEGECVNQDSPVECKVDGFPNFPPS